MKRYNIIVFCFVLIFAGLGSQSCNMLNGKKGTSSNLVKIETEYGDIIVYLYDATPKHKANFLKLVNEKFYDGTTFHRVIKDFIIQGGDPNSKDKDPVNDGHGGPGYMIDAEFNPLIKHKYGAVAAARDNNPEKKSNGSQFYIVVNKEGTHFLDGNYTVFGEVVSGMEAVDKLALIETDGANNRPLKNETMKIEQIKKFDYDSSKLQIK